MDERKKLLLLEIILLYEKVGKNKSLTDSCPQQEVEMDKVFEQSMPKSFAIEVRQRGFSEDELSGTAFSRI